MLTNKKASHSHHQDEDARYHNCFHILLFFEDSSRCSISDSIEPTECPISMLLLVCAKPLWSKNGRHGRSRTADFYRVKVALSP
jgi:hypothetical protein